MVDFFVFKAASFDELWPAPRPARRDAGRRRGRCVRDSAPASRCLRVLSLDLDDLLEIELDVVLSHCASSSCHATSRIVGAPAARLCQRIEPGRPLLLVVGCLRCLAFGCRVVLVLTRRITGMAGRVAGLPHCVTGMAGRIAGRSTDPTLRVAGNRPPDCSERCCCDIDMILPGPQQQAADPQITPLTQSS